MPLALFLAFWSGNAIAHGYVHVTTITGAAAILVWLIVRRW